MPFHMKIKPKYTLDFRTTLDHALIHIPNKAKQTLKTYPGNKSSKPSLENKKAASNARKSQII